MMQIEFPWPNPKLSPNGRPVPREKARLIKEARTKAANVAWDAGLRPGCGMAPARVTFHPPPRGTRDLTNMIGSWKATEDGLADALGADDAHWRPEYEVAQRMAGGRIVVTLTTTAR
jgi:crossover junction endodeoxyribonuclease RusA